jgi:hypothetical protein
MNVCGILHFFNFFTQDKLCEFKKAIGIGRNAVFISIKKHCAEKECKVGWGHAINEAINYAITAKF